MAVDGVLRADAMLASAEPSSEWRPSRLAIASAVVAVAAGNLLPGAGIEAPVIFALAAVAAVAGSAWLQTDRQNIAAYLSLLGVQFVLPTSIVPIAFRIAVSDFFLVPVIVRGAWEVGRRRCEWPASTLRRPFVALVGAFAVATAVGVARNRVLPAYVWFSKDLGLLFLIAGFFALAMHLRARRDVMRALDFVVSGAAIVNAIAVAAAILSVTVWPNQVFVVSTQRLYGWMFNPSSYGTFMATGVLLALGCASETTGPRRSSAIRWAGVGLMAASASFTVSRSVWLCLAAGAAVLFLLLVVDPHARARNRAALAAACALMLASGAAMAWIAAANWQSIGATLRSPESQAAEVQQRMADVCVTRWYSSCGVLSSEQLEAARVRRGRGESSIDRGATGAASVTHPDGSMLNSRGLTDRAAIASVAWRAYARNAWSILLGIGLGTFYETSEGFLGLQLIVHNTAVWFLVELGPLGLFAFLWLLASAARMLWRVRRSDPRLAGVAAGLAAAVAAWAMFSLFNEAFYARHLWFVLVCIDRLAASLTAGAMPAPGGS